MNYREYRHIAQTGDLVFISGSGLWPWVIQTAQRIAGFKGYKWNHVGMVVHHEALDALYLFEAVDKYGVIVSFLSTRIHAVLEGGTDVCVRRVKHAINATKAQRFAQVRRQLLERKYENNFFEMVQSLATNNPRDGGKKKMASVFCSELVAEVLRRWGWLPEAIAPNKYCPAELYSAGLLGHYKKRGERIR